jgi:hypothetical protein
MSLPMTSALSRIADEQGFDLSEFEKAEMVFERKVQELRDWLRDTRPGDAASGPGSHASHHAASGVDGPSGFDPYRKGAE